MPLSEVRTLDGRVASELKLIHTAVHKAWSSLSAMSGKSHATPLPEATKQPCENEDLNERRQPFDQETKNQFVDQNEHRTQ